MRDLRLYHGSTYVVEKPNLEVLNYKTDFGKGFYTTTDFEQAKRWTKIKEKRLKEKNPSEKICKYINVFEYTVNEDLNILNFEEANEEWLKFVFSNRQSSQLLHQYDIVSGPVANDNLYGVIVNYENGIYNLEETIKRLKTYLLANQVSFHTLKSLECLKYVETIEVGDNDD